MLVNLKLYHRNSPAIIDGLNVTSLRPMGLGQMWYLNAVSPEAGTLIELRRAVLKWLASRNTKTHGSDSIGRTAKKL
jgi:hypothetical protein